METALDTGQFFSLESYTHTPSFRGMPISLGKCWRGCKEYLKSLDLGKIAIDVPSTVILVNPELISIGEGTVIEPGAYIQGPCIIGKNCTVRHGAYIRGDVITGDHCVIGHDTEVRHSVFLDRACAAHFNYVGDSVLGNGVNLGAGVKCANLRLDHRPIHVVVSGERIDTKFK